MAACVDYHRSVKHLISSVVLVCLVVLAACNSGSHPPRIGSAAPQFTITDSQRTVALNQFQGKPVVLNFWATWCPPCIQEMPALVQLQKQLGDKVTIIAVSEDDDDSAYKQFIRDHNVDLLTVRDSGQKANGLYGTFKFPETFVIDRDGKIVRKFIGAQEWTSPEIVDYLKKM
jgi:thiol-disulfide isomerase/thioredoxin